MKKITFVLTFLAFSTLIDGNVYADSYKYTPYVGMGYDFSKIQAGKLRPEYNGGTVYVGSDYSKYFGTEVFFSQSLSRKNGQTPHKLKSSFRAYGLDVAAYLPLGCSQKFSLMATAGWGEYIFNLKQQGAKHHNEHGYGYRLGGGIKYALDNHWQTRLVVRHVSFDKLDMLNQTMEYSLNVEYHF